MHIHIHKRNVHMLTYVPIHTYTVDKYKHVHHILKHACMTTCTTHDVIILHSMYHYNSVCYHIEFVLYIEHPHTSPYIPIHPHTSRYIPIHPHTSHTSPYIPIHVHTCPYMSIHPQTVCICLQVMIVLELLQGDLRQFLKDKGSL